MNPTAFLADDNISIVHPFTPEVLNSQPLTSPVAFLTGTSASLRVCYMP